MFVPLWSDQIGRCRRFKRSLPVEWQRDVERYGQSLNRSYVEWSSGGSLWCGDSCPSRCLPGHVHVGSVLLSVFFFVLGVCELDLSKERSKGVLESPPSVRDWIFNKALNCRVNFFNRFW